MVANIEILHLFTNIQCYSFYIYTNTCTHSLAYTCLFTTAEEEEDIEQYLDEEEFYYYNDAEKTYKKMDWRNETENCADMNNPYLDDNNLYSENEMNNTSGISFRKGILL